MSIRRSDSIPPETVQAFAQRLDDFAAGLSERERAILHALVSAALPPLERMRGREAAEVLSPEEQLVLEKLLARTGPQP